MNLDRLFELAGINLLLEAAYDGMIDSLKKQFPNNIKEIDDNINQAKTILIKQDRIVWYLKVLRAYLSNNINTVKGDYNFQSLGQFNNDLFHYYGYNNNDINSTQLTNQNISELFQHFDAAISKYRQSDKAPVPIQHGDYELIKCTDGNSWWFVDRAFCEEEGRSGKHCGNVTGKHDTTQRILSLRTPTHNVILTFILLENGFLGEMKAKANLKPQEKYHPDIMQLLLNPIVKGIKGAGYAPWMNFSIFDLSDENIKILIQHGKESFIANQIQAEPIELLKAPEYIKNNKEYQQIAIRFQPGLQHIIGNETSLDAWENAIEENGTLIIYAPNTLKNFKNRIIDYLMGLPQNLLKCPKSISQDYDIVEPLVSNRDTNIKYVVPSTPRYSDLAKIAVENNSYNLNYIPDTTKDYAEICKIALKDSATAMKYIPSTIKEYYELCKYAAPHSGGALEYIEDNFKTFELCELFVSNWGYSLEYVPFDKFSNAQIVKLCQQAVYKSIQSLQYVPFDDLSFDEGYEICKIPMQYKVIQKRAMEYIPSKFHEKLKQEFNIQESVDFKYFQNL